MPLPPHQFPINPHPLPLPPIVLLDPDVLWLQGEGAYVSGIGAAASGLKQSESDISSKTNFNSVYAGQFTTPFTAIDATSAAIFTTPTRPTDDASRIGSIASRLQSLITQNAQLTAQLAAAQAQAGAARWTPITEAQVPHDVQSAHASTPPAGTPTPPGTAFQSGNGCWYSYHLNIATNPPTRAWYILQPCVPTGAVSVPNPVHAPAPPAPASQSGMSTGTKVGLVVAGLGVLVLGTGAYFYFRDRREERA